MSQTQRVSYRRTPNAFRIESEGTRYIMPAPAWNKFLERHGNQPNSSSMENVYGLTSVNRDDFNQMIYSHQANTTINAEILELIKVLSNEITGVNYDAPSNDYIKQLIKKVDGLQKRLKFFQHNFENRVNPEREGGWN